MFVFYKDGTLTNYTSRLPSFDVLLAKILEQHNRIHLHKLIEMLI